MLGHHINVRLVSPNGKTKQVVKLILPWTIKPGEDDCAILYVCGALNYPKRYNGYTITITNRQSTFMKQVERDFSLTYTPTQIKDAIVRYARMIE